MKICIIGGHGKIALLLHPLLVESGHEVSALIRNEAHIEAVNETGRARSGGRRRKAEH